MAGHKVKCPGCGEYFDKDQFPHEHIKNRYWHKDCYLKTTQNAIKDNNDRLLLEKYICELFSVDFIPPRIAKQIKDFTTNYHHTHSGILGTLKFWYEIKKNSIEKANTGIGIVPFVYEDAKKYYLTIYNSSEKNKNVKDEDFNTKNITIRIKAPKSSIKTNIKIDLDNIERDLDGRESIT